jgi:hypothetical protein
MKFFKNIFKTKNEESEKSPAYKAYLATDLSKYKTHEYVVFSSKGEYDHGMDAKRIIKNFEKEFPNETPFVYKVPPKGFVTKKDD